jgi:hypothetical protein
MHLTFERLDRNSERPRHTHPYNFDRLKYSVDGTTCQMQDRENQSSQYKHNLKKTYIYYIHSFTTTLSLF